MKLKCRFPLHITVWRQKEKEQLKKNITSMWRKMLIGAIVILKDPIFPILPAVCSSVNIYKL